MIPTNAASICLVAGMALWYIGTVTYAVRSLLKDTSLPNTHHDTQL